MCRIHGCGYTRHLEPEVGTHLDWGVSERFGQLRLVLRGGVRLRIDDRAVEIGPGGGLSLLLPARGIRSEVARLPTDILWIQFSGAAALGLLQRMQREVGVLQQLPRRGRAERTLRKIIREAVADPVRDPFHWSERGQVLLHAWWQECLAAERAGRDPLSGGGSRPLPARLQRRSVAPPEASPLLREAPRTVGEFAERLGYSRSHLTRILRESWKETPAAVLRRDRMERARELLRRGGSVAQAAADAGYASHQTFSRAYRRHFGRLPSAEGEAEPGEG
ncbi:putative AraC family transcriptional regulator [Phycisphaera mikurensis NBRC 102666]|uniref:Putative AraC family transcriptional regulator n=2 Tax=Phycisphaera TaxID=666508 RepID=I0IER1_PHYMF|nr:putative AraC family transcriptional regulator [Phycisphaera mikurensis NBRC 102666]